MHFKKISIFLALILAIGILGCAEERKIEVPIQERIPTEQITTNLVPPNVEVKGSPFFVGLNDLKVIIKVRKASKEIIETPRLKGNIKITNIAKDQVGIARVTLEYLDETGKPISHEPEERIAMGSRSTQWGWSWKILWPGDVTEESFDVPIPMSVIKEKSLRQIAVTLAYNPSFPLDEDQRTYIEQETLTLPVMLSTDFNI
jgi:hypothetical protein